MDRAEALGVLGLTGRPRVDKIQTVFRLAMRDAHPDTSLSGSADKVQRLKAARDCLLHHDAFGDSPCKLCRGVGYVNGIKCSSCGGRK